MPRQICVRYLEIQIGTDLDSHRIYQQTSFVDRKWRSPVRRRIRSRGEIFLGGDTLSV